MPRLFWVQRSYQVKIITGSKLMCKYSQRDRTHSHRLWGWMQTHTHVNNRAGDHGTFWMIYPGQNEKKKGKTVPVTADHIYFIKELVQQVQKFSPVSLLVWCQRKRRKQQEPDKREDYRRETEEERTKENANKLWIKCCYVHYMNNPKGIQSLHVCVCVCVCVPMHITPSMPREG